MTTNNEQDTGRVPFVPTEVAFRKLTLRGAGPWKVKVFTKEAAFDRFVEAKLEAGWEIQTRDALVNHDTPATRI